MEIIFSKLHHIDYESNTIELAEMVQNDVTKYINIVLKQTIENANSRKFKIRDNTTQVISITNRFIETFRSGEALSEEELNKNTYKIAERLSKKEKEKEEIISRMGSHIQKGSLIQTLARVDDELVYIFSKVEYKQYLDKSEAHIRTGLPLEKVILKTCIISYNELEIVNISIFDSTGSIADYWSNGLFELDEASSNEANTSGSFGAIDKFLIKNVKTVSKSDHTLLRNSAIAYYNQNEIFNFSDFVNKVFTKYQPEDTNLDMQSLCAKIEELPKRKNFERNFTIIPKIIRARKRRVVVINPNIELVLKDSTENMKETIKGLKDKDGELYLKIRVNKGVYDEFNFH